MTANPPVDGSPATGTGTLPSAAVPAPPSWPWRRAALFLAGAAQLITISALVGVDPPPVTWASVLLAIAPAPLAAVTAFAPALVGRLAAVAGVLVLVAGMAGAWRHTGLFSSRHWQPWLSVVPSCGVSDLDPAGAAR